MRFVFTNEFKLSKLDEIMEYLTGPRLWIPQKDYPDYIDWLDKVYDQIKKDEKRAVIALLHNQLVGAAIYQRHKFKKSVLEIKNLTVRPDVQGRYVASFLLRNTEFLGQRDFKCEKVVCDTKLYNLPVRSFLSHHKYVPQFIDDLYKLKSGKDIVYSKTLRKIDFN